MKNLLALLLLLFTSFACQSPTPESNNTTSAKDDGRPNVLLIVADDHGKDAIGAYGNPIIQTPNIDQLANEGLRFDRAYCTTASCSASRSVILSGMHNHANGHYGHQHAFHHFSSFPDVVTLPVYLKQAGYRTARIGKYHVAPESVYKFDEALPGNARNSVLMANNSEAFMKADGPFFLYYCTSDPHRGGGFAEELPHAPDRFGNKPPGESYEGIEEVIYNPDEVIVPPFLPNTPETKSEVAQYYQSISRLDQGVGRLIEILKEAGKYENTLIIYISDNGMAFPGAKTTLYQAGMELPCIVKPINANQGGQATQAMVSWVDLAPTILDYVDAMPPENRFQGQSFAPVIRGESNQANEAIYASHTFHEITMYYPMRVISNGKYKLIVNFAHGLEYPFASDLYASKTWQSVLTGNLDKLGQKEVDSFLHRPKFELYDIENDPWEAVNLAIDPQYSEILNGMVDQIKTFQEKSNDPWEYKWTYE